MKVNIVFDPDSEFPGHDPNDEHKVPQSLGVHLGDNADVLLVWREWGEQFEDGYRTHVIGQGVFENVDDERFGDALAHIEGFGDEEEPA